MRPALAAALGAAFVLGCANQDAGAGSASSTSGESDSSARATSDDPYPSTYRPYPGVTTAIVGATIFDGEGGRIDNGTLVLADGRIQAVGGADTPIPEGAVRIDGADRVLHPTWRMARPGRVRVAFGAPLRLQGDDYAALALEVERAVRAL